MSRLKISYSIACFIWFFVSCNEVPAQQPPVGRSLDSLVLKYPFVRTDLNHLSNDSLVLASFYEKLWELSNGKRDRVTVVHIGDSHIQADIFSGTVRKDLQHQFGNAGRGTVYPYRTAKSNEPSGYRSSSSNGNWTFKRNVFVDDPMPIGLSGFTLETPDTNATILLTVKDEEGLDYGFNKFTLFHSKGTGYYDFAVCDELSCRMGYFDATQGDPNVSVMNFDHPMHSIMLDCMPHDTTGKKVQIYGMLLENGQPGVIYNMIGVNGAMYRSYNRSALFLEQLEYLKPDLVIISLGTNEGFANGFKSDLLYKNMDTLVKNIRKIAPDSQFLITTPGDSFKRTKNGRVKNPNMLEARNTIIGYCNQEKLAYWDLFGVMGGYGSMAQWYTSGLAAKDRLHFSKPGYELQGELFYSAVMKSYEQYVIRTHGK